MPLKWIVKFFSVLNANRRPSELAGGIALGFLMALQPGFTFFRLLELSIAFLLKVHFPTAILALFLFSFLAPLFDPLLDIIGGLVLMASSLTPLWSALYSYPLVPLTRINNTVVMGALFGGIVLAVPVYVLSRKGIHQYRETWRDRIAELPVVKAFLKAPLVAKILGWVGKIMRMSEGV